MTEALSTVRGGLPVVVTGRYVAGYAGDFQCPPEPETFEDVEIFWNKKKRPLKHTPFDFDDLNDGDQDQIMSDLFDALKYEGVT